MRDVFKGFLLLRLIGLLALVMVVGAVLGIRSLARGSDVAGVAILVGVVLVGGATASLLARRAR